MRAKYGVLALVGVCGLAASAIGQDSVSSNTDGGNGLPGDALNPYVAGTPNQRASYVVDLQDHFTSTGVLLGIGPVVKTSKINAAFFSSLTASQAISFDTLLGVPYASASYKLWTVPGGGINTTENLGTTSNVSPAGTATRVVAAIRENTAVDSPASTFASQLISAAIDFNPAEPGRLYVTKTVAAVNGASNTGTRTASFGFGSVDANQNLHLRADNSSSTAIGAVTGQNYYRINVDARNTGIINTLQNPTAADAGATERLLTDAPTTLTFTPGTIIPQSIAGRPVYVGAKFGNATTSPKLASESVAGSITEYPATGAGGYLQLPATDQRGLPSFGPDYFFTGGGSTGVLGSTAAGTTAIVVVGLNADGSPAAGLSYTFDLPVAGVTDNCWGPIGQSAPYTFTGVFDGYRSQVAFQGGNGMVALGRDLCGKGLAAATMYSTGTAQNPVNAVAVARFDPADPNATVEWTLAAYNDTINADPNGGFNGKPLIGDNGLDGRPFTGDLGEFDGIVDSNDGPIGRLALAPELSGVGPSFSSPAFDSAGNIYFIATAGLYKSGVAGNFTDFDNCLIRGIYNRATFCYDLELVLELGKTFDGPNSGRKYQVTFLDIADSNSVSSGTMFSGNVNGQAWNGAIVPPWRSTASAEHLGGLVFSASVVYDADNDGDFENPTSTGGNLASADESYNVLMYLGNKTGAACFADYNNDLFVDAIDYDLFIADWLTTNCNADSNRDGFVDAIDYDIFIAQWLTPCP